MKWGEVSGESGEELICAIVEQYGQIVSFYRHLHRSMRSSEIRNGAPQRSGIALKPVEASGQGCLEILQPREKLVVGNGPFGFPPDVFHCIEFR